MSNLYMQYKKEVREEVNNFPMFCAFNQEQLEKGCEKLKVNVGDISGIGLGCFIRTSDEGVYSDMCSKHYDKKEELMKNPKFVYEMFRYELANHEFCITYDYEDTLDACNLSVEEVKANRMLSKQLFKAKNDYLANCDY